MLIIWTEFKFKLGTTWGQKYSRSLFKLNNQIKFRQAPPPQCDNVWNERRWKQHRTDIPKLMTSGICSEVHERSAVRLWLVIASGRAMQVRKIKPPTTSHRGHSIWISSKIAMARQIGSSYCTASPWRMLEIKQPVYGDPVGSLPIHLKIRLEWIESDERVLSLTFVKTVQAVDLLLDKLGI